jgi:hypothetical protein
MTTKSVTCSKGCAAGLRAIVPEASNHLIREASASGRCVYCCAPLPKGRAAWLRRRRLVPPAIA